MPLTHIPSLVSGLIDGADIAAAAAAEIEQKDIAADSTHAYFMKGRGTRHNNTATCDGQVGLVLPSLRVNCLSVCLSAYCC